MVTIIKLWGLSMKPLLCALFVVFGVVFACGGLSAQKSTWQPSPGHTQVPIWPGAVPDARPVAARRLCTTDAKELVAGKPWVYVSNVSRPTMTVYSPKGKNTGAAVVVFPGGGYQILAIDLEGTEICDWLTSKGITAVLLKYRVPDSRPQLADPSAIRNRRWRWKMRRGRWGWCAFTPPSGISIRTRSECIGFSAGGHMVAAMSTHFEKRLYPAVDAADKESCRPDFAVALYPGHLWIADRKVLS